MRGSVFKRCTCPVRRDERGRKITCGKQHGSWSYKVDLPAVGGRRKQLVKGGFPTKRDAEEAMAEAVAKASRGQLVAPTRLTVGAYLTDWLAAVKPALAPAAFTNYRSCIALYVEPHLSDVPLAKLTGATLTLHYSSLLSGGGRKGKALSPTTVRTVHRVLSKAFNDAVRDDLLLVAPTMKAVPPRRRRYEAASGTPSKPNSSSPRRAPIGSTQPGSSPSDAAFAAANSRDCAGPTWISSAERSPSRRSGRPTPTTT